MRVRVGDDTLEERLEVPCHARDRFAVEQINVVDQLAEQPARFLGTFEAQVEQRSAWIEVDLFNLQTRKLHILQRVVPQLERHLEDWRITQVALGMNRLDDDVEWQILMRVVLERGVASLSQQLAKSRVARQIAAHRQRVYE